MYKVVLSIFTICILAFGCSDQKRIQQLEEKHTQLETEYQLLLGQAETNKRFIEEYSGTITEVYGSLERIRERENYLVLAANDLEAQGNSSAQSRRQMLNDITSIDNDLQESQRRLNTLSQRLKESTINTTQLQAVVDTLQASLSEKESQIQEIKAKFDDLNQKISDVETELTLKEQEIIDQRRILETTYFVIGTSKELKEKGIIEEKGGFLGINKTKKLAPNFNKDYFIPMDINKTSIPIGQNIKKIKIISPHNPSSYELTPTSESETLLEITNSNEFWKIKYLVIQAKG